MYEYLYGQGAGVCVCVCVRTWACARVCVILECVCELYDEMTHPF